jgi:predicted O-methyltransferase YrrM
MVPSPLPHKIDCCTAPGIGRPWKTLSVNDERNERDVADRLMELAGGDPFVEVRLQSETHQSEHGCGLHNAGGPQMQLIAALARNAAPLRVLDLGSGLGYSTLWIAQALEANAHILGIGADPIHVTEATKLANRLGYGQRVTYRAGYVADVLPKLEGPFDMINDDAWFAKTPDHLDSMIGLLRPGGLLTMVNWFLLVDALSGQPRNDWAAFAGPTWAEDTKLYAELLARHHELDVIWVTRPPIAFATKRR